MSALDRLARLDRRWIFLVTGLLVLIPLLWPLNLPLTPAPPVRAYHDAIASVPPGSHVLVSADFDPAARPELEPMLRTTLRQLLQRRCKVVVVVLYQGGPLLVDQIVRDVAAAQGAVYGRDLVNLGFKAGNEAVMVLMGQSIPNTFPRDQSGADVRTLPVMRDVRNYSSFRLLVSIATGYPGTKEYVQQVQGRFHIPIVAGVTAVTAPTMYPYLQSGQLRGLLGGMAGAAEYERLMNERGAASRGMDAQSLAHVFVALCIVLGNLAQRARARREEG
ncbi:MAG TPA: hypothetical protein VMS88_06455 [Terriglobales bacterium]|nr:hypothetical protein [Terriglobales bacterium]